MLKKIINNELDSLFVLTSKFSSDILSLTEVEDIWWHLANNIITEFGFEDLVIYELDKEGLFLNQIAAFGTKTDGKNTVINPITIPFKKGIVGKCAFEMKPQLLNDIKTNKDYIKDGEQRSSELSIPIIVDGKLFGVIDSEDHRKDFYTEKHLKSLSVIAEICGTKVSQLNSLEKLKKTIAENEYTNRVQKSLIEISDTVYESEVDFYTNIHNSISKLTFAKNFYVAYLEEKNNEINFEYYVDELDDVDEDDIFMGSYNNPSLTEYVLKKGVPTLLYQEDILSLIKSDEIMIYGTMPKAWIGIPFMVGEEKGIVVVQSYTTDFIFSEKEKQLLSFIAKHISSAIERKKSNDRLTFLALHDSLTKLPNRALFQDKIKANLQKVKSGRADGVTILYMDLDLFKDVNDTYGHKIGDEILVKSTEKILSCLRSTDTLSRLGGDEFAILLEGNMEERCAERVASDIVKIFETAISIDSFLIKMSVSIGIAIDKKGNETVESLMTKSDSAMYQSKLKGRSQYSIHSLTTKEHHFPVSKIECDFLKSLRNKELFCVYQPLLNFKKNEILSAEVLMRWNHNSLGFIPPIQFIPILEKSGLIIELDMYVLENATETLLRLKDSLPKDFKFNINISTAGFSSNKLIDFLTNKIKKNDCLSNKICIEITEESLISNTEIVKKHISILKDFGVSIALDDFGTGYSSLNYLDQFDFDYLKIDKSFIQDVDKSKKKKLILNAIVNLANTLEIKVTAEGIENKAQFSLMKEMGCNLGQGYLIARPDSEEELLKNVK
jgi:diguanylate cyclase (GGDEF)-like protein